MRALARRFVATSSAIFFTAAVLTAQSPEEASKLFDAGEWGPAAEAYRKVVAADPKNGDAWFHLGIAERNLKQYDASAAAFQKAIDNGFFEMRGYAALGITWAMAGDRDRAFEALSKAVDGGLPSQVLQTHPGLASLRDDPRMAGLLKTAEEKSHPCEHQPRYRAFDFWVGDWDVFQGTQQVGHNRIEKVLDGCALQENWTSGYGNQGRSLNYFDPASGKWKQNWVDDGGSVVWYEGEIVDGAMHFHGENVQPDGKKSLARVLLAPLPDGAVHHVIERSDDGGKTWSKGFDAIYRPAKPKS
jgi:tetratricopeptide (TPR) repeat protein